LPDIRNIFSEEILDRKWCRYRQIEVPREPFGKSITWIRKALIEFVALHGLLVLDLLENLPAPNSRLLAATQGIPRLDSVI
jgi:hypothetical protein